MGIRRGNGAKRDNPIAGNGTESQNAGSEENEAWNAQDETLKTEDRNTCHNDRNRRKSGPEPEKREYKRKATQPR